ncbi:hypothetical protein GYMLUDRAFT_253198 [Collybiopsis luxurians FD-317 M1]|uniref:Uncharacterized protein n=1 Tax=Collybiopsis luxurians FD-317 M1 TaxID=944289 RepID=A0A0D0BXH5_9AGAR|nr:hypothetical protein GYMLUDRAFT_253198 [Collybiopsis luxurians FD-317 M1]
MVTFSDALQHFRRKFASIIAPDEQINISKVKFEDVSAQSHPKSSQRKALPSTIRSYQPVPSSVQSSFTPNLQTPDAYLPYAMSPYPYPHFASLLPLQPSLHSQPFPGEQTFVPSQAPSTRANPVLPSKNPQSAQPVGQSVHTSDSDSPVGHSISQPFLSVVAL